MATIEIFKGKDKQYYFHVKAANGEIIAQSEGYTTKKMCNYGFAALYCAMQEFKMIDLTKKKK